MESIPEYFQRHLWILTYSLDHTATSGDMQTYQIRTTPSATSLPQTVVMTSPWPLHQTSKTDDPQLKRRNKVDEKQVSIKIILSEWVIARFYKSQKDFNWDYMLEMRRVYISFILIVNLLYVSSRSVSPFAQSLINIWPRVLPFLLCSSNSTLKQNF